MKKSLYYIDIMEKYALKTFVPKGKYFHLHRAEIGWSTLDAGHLHGYAEVFWVEKGCICHVRNGVTEKLFAGDVAWLRAGDWHALKSIGPKATIINLAFADSVLIDLERRYYSKANPAPWKFPLNHAINHLETAQLSNFRHLAYSMAFTPQTRLSLEGFLLDFLRALSANNSQDVFLSGDCPGWLTNAVCEFVRQQLWDATPQEFARLAGRSLEHVSRTVRKCSGMTTSELLNGYRLEKSAADLCMTNKAILEISLDAGFENLGYFYRLFRKRFGESPGKFRKSHQSLILRAGHAVKASKCRQHP